jgi:hypothetical protein
VAGGEGNTSICVHYQTQPTLVTQPASPLTTSAVKSPMVGLPGSISFTLLCVFTEWTVATSQGQRERS